MNINPGDIHGDLSGQVAIVTGGGRGLGRAFAHGLAKMGAKVAVVARSTDQIEETVAEIAATGGYALAITADVTDKQAVAQMTSRVELELGRVDLLINNAGIVSPLGPFWEIDPDEWWRSMEINLRSVLLCSASVLPGMVSRHRGRIINVASVAGTRPIPFGSAYVTSKTAMIRLTENLALETADHGIGIFVIHPGNVRTAMSEYLMNSAPGKQWTPWVHTYYDVGRDDPIERSVQLVLRLSAGHADTLSGRYISITDDLDQLVQGAPQVASDELHVLRVRTFQQSSSDE